MVRTGLLSLLTLMLVAPPAMAEDDAFVALPTVTGPSKAAPGKVESGIRSALRKAKLGFVDGEEMAMVDGAGTDIMAARELDADFVLRVEVAKIRKKFRVSAELVSTEDGTVAWSSRRKYKRKKAAWKAGRSIGWLAAKKIKKLRKPAERTVVAASNPPPLPKGNHIEIEEKDDDRETNKARVSVEKKSGKKHPDDKIIRLSVNGGSQLSGAYTVAVGGALTGLAYELSPTGMVGGELLFNIPSTAVSAELSLAYVPMFYSVDVTPAVTPVKPGARHLDFVGSVGYGFKFSLLAENNVELRPLVGLTYRSLAVQQQEPVNVLVGNTSISPHFGGRASLRIGDLTMEMGALFRVIASYKETPSTTGNSGVGYGFLVGATARYWIVDWFGAYVNVGYDFGRVGMKGEGTRVQFEEDTALVDATIYSEEIRAGLGVSAAF